MSGRCYSTLLVVFGCLLGWITSCSQMHVLSPRWCVLSLRWVSGGLLALSLGVESRGLWVLSLVGGVSMRVVRVRDGTDAPI